MGTKGYDVFFSEPSKVGEMTCRVCGAKCDVRRGVSGPTSVAAAMGKLSAVHDCYSCPRSQEPWHDEALELVRAIDESHSPSLQALMQKDLDDLLAKHPLSSADGDQRDRQA